MSSSKGRKDKGKAKVTQTPANYQIQIPIQNQFQPIAPHFPPLTYKTAALQSPTKPNTDKAYSTRHVEHITLLSHTTLQNPPPLRTCIRKLFGDYHFATDDLTKTRKFYELILVDTQSVDFTHTPDKYYPDQFLYSKCIIKQVLGSKNWPDPFSQRKFSITFSPQTFNYNDYRNAWFRAFLYQPETHSWFFNFHDNCSIEFPIWFYYWWTYFGCSHTILPNGEALEGWELWFKRQTSIEAFMRELLFFRHFNIAWIFSWEYKIQPYLQTPFPPSIVRIYKIKWWSEFKTILCGKENVEHFCEHKIKKFTLHNLHLMHKQIGDGPSTPLKKEVSPSSSKIKRQGLSQTEKDILDYLKDDPAMKKAFLQKILDKQQVDEEDEETVSSAASSTPVQKPPIPQTKRWADYEDSQDPYDM